MKGMMLPQMSTAKPFQRKYKVSGDATCPNILNKQFNPSAPNKVWVCDFTYLRAIC